jgi:hypothetical protein
VTHAAPEARSGDANLSRKFGAFTVEDMSLGRYAVYVSRTGEHAIEVRTDVGPAVRGRVEVLSADVRPVVDVVIPHGREIELDLGLWVDALESAASVHVEWAGDGSSEDSTLSVSRTRRVAPLYVARSVRQATVRGARGLTGVVVGPLDLPSDAGRVTVPWPDPSLGTARIRVVGLQSEVEVPGVDVLFVRRGATPWLARTNGAGEVREHLFPGTYRVRVAGAELQSDWHAVPVMAGEASAVVVPLGVR